MDNSKYINKMNEDVPEIIFRYLSKDNNSVTESDISVLMKLRYEAEQGETLIDMEYMIHPDEKIAIQLKDARIKTERCIRAYERGLNLLRAEIKRKKSSHS